MCCVRPFENAQGQAHALLPYSNPCAATPFARALSCNYLPDRHRSGVGLPICATPRAFRAFCVPRGRQRGTSLCRPAVVLCAAPSIVSRALHSPCCFPPRLKVPSTNITQFIVGTVFEHPSAIRTNRGEEQTVLKTPHCLERPLTSPMTQAQLRCPSARAYGLPPSTS